MTDADIDIEILKEKIKKDIDGYRYIHTLSVCDECGRLAEMFSLSENDRISLQIAALLHDITKSYDKEGQCALAKKLCLDLDEDYIMSPAVLHAFTGAAYAEKEYGKYTNADVLSAIECHTTGKPNMSLLDKLLFIADYIEPTREHAACKDLRDFFYNCHEDIFVHLDKTLLRSFDNTITLLIGKGGYICQKTVAARNFILKSLKSLKSLDL